MRVIMDIFGAHIEASSGYAFVIVAGIGYGINLFILLILHLFK